MSNLTTVKHTIDFKQWRTLMDITRDCVHEDVRVVVARVLTMSRISQPIDYIAADIDERCRMRD